jgi:hypothetical protein
MSLNESDRILGNIKMYFFFYIYTAIRKKHTGLVIALIFFFNFEQIKKDLRGASLSSVFRKEATFVLKLLAVFICDGRGNVRFYTR